MVYEYEPITPLPFLVLTCRDYSVEMRRPTAALAVEACRMLERETGDGYARIVSLYGRHVANADGPYPPDGYSVDVATATGMYDGW